MNESEREFLVDAMTNGIPGEGLVEVSEQNLGKNYFPTQAREFYDVTAEIAKPGAPRNEGLRTAFTEGLSGEKICSFFDKNIDSKDILFAARAVARTNQRVKSKQVQAGRSYVFTKNAA